MSVIPRYSGDVPDPRGGIRRIKKSLVPYLEEGENEEGLQQAGKR